MNREDLFLKIIHNTLDDSSYLGDDCAYIKDLDILVSQDTLYEDIHFKRSYYSAHEIGKKAVLVNVSDILSGGGKPLYITISLSGNLDENFIKEFYTGVLDAAKKYNIKVIGGDLTGGDKIVVSITIIGSAKGRKISSRKNALAGDFVYLAGYHGSSAAGLELLQKGVLNKDNEFIKSHIEPDLYPEISYAVSKNAKHNYAMMDTSDGLYDALNKISKASNVGFNIDYQAIPKKTDNKNFVLFGGEDFGLLICLNQKDCHIMEGCNIKKIGTVTNSKKIIIDGVEINKDESFSHFK